MQRPWAIVHRVVLYRGTTRYKGSLSECAGLAEKNEECGIELYYAGSSTAATSDCVCVKKGEECIKKPSKRTNHLYKYHCDGGTLSGGFKNGGPHGYAEWREANGAQFDGYYATGAMVNGTYTWADGGEQVIDLIEFHAHAKIDVSTRLELVMW